MSVISIHVHSLEIEHRRRVCLYVYGSVVDLVFMLLLVICLQRIVVIVVCLVSIIAQVADINSLIDLPVSSLYCW